MKTFDDCKPKILELVNLIRNKQPSTSLFLAMYETFPKDIWEKSVKEGIMTSLELQSCLLVLKQYRRLQATSAIKGISNDLNP